MAGFGIPQGLEMLGGAMGLLQGKGESKARNRALGDAESFQNFQRGGVESNYRRAQDWAQGGYKRETNAAVSNAANVTGNTLTNALHGLATSFGNSGGQIGGDTAFKVNAQGLTNRAADPLRQFIADRQGNEFSATQDKLVQALGAQPGQIANTYFGLAGSRNNDMSGSMNLLSGAIRPYMQNKENQQFANNISRSIG